MATDKKDPKQPPIKKTDPPHPPQVPTTNASVAPANQRTMIVDRDGACQSSPVEMATQYTDDLMCLDLSDTADLLTDSEPHQMDLDVLFNAIVSDVTQDGETILTSHLEDTSQVEPQSPFDDPSSPESLDGESPNDSDVEPSVKVQEEVEEVDIPIPTMIPLVALEAASDSEWEKEDEKPRKRSKRKRKPTKKSEYMESLSSRSKRPKMDKSDSVNSAKSAKVKKVKKESPVVVVKEERVDSRSPSCVDCGHHGNNGSKPVFCPSIMYPTIRMNLESPPEVLHNLIVPLRPAPVKQELAETAPCMDSSNELCSQSASAAKDNVISSPRRPSASSSRRSSIKDDVPKDVPFQISSQTAPKPSRSPLQEALSTPPLDCLAARLAAPPCLISLAPSPATSPRRLSKSPATSPCKLASPSPPTPPGLNRAAPTSPPMWGLETSRDGLEMGEMTPSESSTTESPPAALLTAAEQAELMYYSSEGESDEEDFANDSKRSPVERERLERRRYNNRVAAQRCRQRKREHFQTLKKEIQDWECQNTQLRYEIHVLRKQVQQLTTMWTEHATVCKRLNPKLAKSKRKHKHRRRKLLKAHPELVQQLVVAV